MRPLPKLPRTFEPEQLEFRNNALGDELDSFNKSLFLELQAMFTATDFYAFAMLGAHDVVGCYSGYFFGRKRIDDTRWYCRRSFTLAVAILRS